MESFPAILKVLQKVCYDGNLELRAVGNFGLMSELLYHTVGTEEKYPFRRVVKVTDKATWCSWLKTWVHKLNDLPSLQIVSSPDAQLLM